MIHYQIMSGGQKPYKTFIIEDVLNSVDELSNDVRKEILSTPVSVMSIRVDVSDDNKIHGVYVKVSIPNLYKEISEELYFSVDEEGVIQINCREDLLMEGEMWVKIMMETNEYLVREKIIVETSPITCRFNDKMLDIYRVINILKF